MNKYKETARHKEGKIESTGITRVTKETVTLLHSYKKLIQCQVIFLNSQGSSPEQRTDLKDRVCISCVALVFSYIRICSVRLVFEAITLTDICIVTHPCTLFTSNEPSV